jgi:hypothetical protein
MKKLLYLFAIVIFFSCNEKLKYTQKIVPRTLTESKYKKLLSKFKTITIDTIKVYSSDDYENYKGIRLDSLDAILFPKEIAEAYFHEQDLYACYKFEINATKIGLLTRTPSMYVPSSIKLFIYNKALDSITEYIELAELWGDAGDALEKTSWIIKSKENEINALIKVTLSHDHSVEDEKDTIIESSDNHFLIDLLKPKIDTINIDSESLIKRYKLLLK